MTVVALTRGDTDRVRGGSTAREPGATTPAVPPTAPPEGTSEETTPVEPAPVESGLTDLHATEAVQFEVEADFSNRNINGKVFDNAFTGIVYPDGSGLRKLTVVTQRRFDTMAFTVGIDSKAECPGNRARVSLTDQDGRRLWGPVTVSISKSATRQRLPIPSPVQVNFVASSASAGGDDACDYGAAQVSWGGVVFRGPGDG